MSSVPTDLPSAQNHGPLMSLKEAQAQLSDEFSCLRLVCQRMCLALSPRFIGDINKGISDHLKVKLGSYCQEFEGVPIGYVSVQREQEGATIVGDQPYLHLSVQAKVIVFQPNVGSKIRAVVNKTGTDYVGCLVHNYFNASILRPLESRKKGRGDAQLEIDKWSKLQVGDELIVEIAKVFTQNRGLSMRCRLIISEDETDAKAFLENPSTVETLEDATEVKSVHKKKKKKKDKKVKSEPNGHPSLEDSVAENTLEVTQSELSSEPLTVENLEDATEVKSVHKKKKKKKDKRVKSEPNGHLSLGDSMAENTLDMTQSDLSSEPLTQSQSLTPTESFSQNNLPVMFSTPNIKQESSIRVKEESVTSHSHKKKKKKRHHSDSSDSGIAGSMLDVSVALPQDGASPKKSKKRKHSQVSSLETSDVVDYAGDGTPQSERKKHKKHKKIKLEAE